MAHTAQRYTAVAIILHWTIAAAIVVNIALGLWMHEAIDQPNTMARAIASYQLHKSIGLTVLVLTLVRLGWRLLHPPPPLPAAMPLWEKIAAKATHWAFYALLVAIPLSGWLYVSAQWRHGAPLNVPTLWFGLFEVPHLFGLNEGSTVERAAASETAMGAHKFLVFGAVMLLFLHVGAAFKHHVLDGDEVLAHMTPGLKAPNEAATPRSPRRAAALAVGFAAMAVAGAALLFAFLRVPVSEAAPTQIQPSHSHDHAQDPAVGQAAPSASTPVSAEAAPAAPQVGGGGAAPAAWSVDRGNSSITFSGTYGGAPMRGRFDSWRGDIRFDPANLSASQAVITIQTGSARTGISELDGGLSSAEAFDTANHPTATFRTTRITHRGGNNYEAQGTLTLKGRAISLAVPFTLTIAGDRATFSGQTRIDRTQANVGMTTDPSASFVSREIGVNVAIQATRGR